MREIRVFDMFCGGGGSSLGAKAAGARIVGGADMDEYASHSFRANFPEAKLLSGDLRLYDTATVARQVGRVDLVLSSPECTNHTCAKGSAPRSEESRETALQVLRYAETLEPRWIVLENVVHMRPWKRYAELREGLSDLGYHVHELVLDAADFGVPQRRRRLFLLADRVRRPDALSFTKKTPKPASSILDARGAWNTTLLRRQGRAKDTLERADRAIAEVGTKAPFLVVYYGTDGAGGWQSLDVPLRTITTLDRFALVEPGPNGHTMRMLQPSELRRAMGFPASYRFAEGTRRDKIRLLGNAVCPPVMRQVVEKLTACGRRTTMD